MNPALHIVRVPDEPSERVLRACASFGIVVEQGPRADAHHHPLRSLLALEPGRVALITGPSGSGKSTLLASLHRALRAQGSPAAHASINHAPSRSAILDLIPGSAHAAARLLASLGLAEPALWPLRPEHLSVGERARFALASACASLPRAAWLLADEFTSSLDGVTARSVSRGLARLAAARDLRVVCASTRPARALHADLVVELHLPGSNRA